MKIEITQHIRAGKECTLHAPGEVLDLPEPEAMSLLRRGKAREPGSTESDPEAQTKAAEEAAKAEVKKVAARQKRHQATAAKKATAKK